MNISPLTIEQLRKKRISDNIFITAKAPNEATTIMAVRNSFRLFYFDNNMCAAGLRHLDLVHRTYNKDSKRYSDKVVHDEHSHAFHAIGILAYNTHNDSYYNDDIHEDDIYPAPRSYNFGGVFD